MSRVSITEMISKAVRENIFCYSKLGGEGYQKKELCTCYNEQSGKKSFCCQAIKDKDLFHSLFEGLDIQQVAMNKKKIIEDNKHLFKESQWFKDNVEV